MPYPLRTLSENNSNTGLNFLICTTHQQVTESSPFEATGSDWAWFTFEEIPRNALLGLSKSLHADPSVGFTREHIKVSQRSRQTKIKEGKTRARHRG